VGWVFGSVLEAGSDQNSGLGLYSGPGQNLDPGSRLGSNLEFVSSSLSLEPVARFLGSLRVTGLDFGHGPSSVEFPPSLVRVLCKNAGSTGDGSTGDALLPDLGFSIPLAEVLPASPLNREWEVYFSSMPGSESCLGVSTLELTELMRLSVLKEAFSIPWEVDALASPLCRDREVTFSRVEETQVVPPSPAKGLLRRGFFGPRAASPSPVVLKEASLSSMGKDLIPEFGLIRWGFLGSSSVSSSLPVVLPIIGVAELVIHSLAAASLPSSQVCTSLSDGVAVLETRKNPFNSSVSTSQLWYSWRVKEKVAK
jgi:hypothetical protein